MMSEIMVGEIMIAGQIALRIFAFLVMLVSVYLFLRTRGHGRDLEPYINEYGFTLKMLAPVGLFIHARYGPLLQSKKQPKIVKKMSDFFGIQRAELFSVIHSAQKLVLVLTGLNMICLLILMGNWDLPVLLSAVVLNVLMFYWPDKGLDVKIEQRKKEILIELPEFMNSIILLMNAGLSFHTALEKTLMDRVEKRALYRELHQLMSEIKSGKPMVQAYENLAQRCRVPEITRLVSAIIQNLNKGTDDFILNLKNFTHEAWAKRKEIARKQGEEAAAKLVFPMVMIFLAITMIVLAPAFFSMML